MWHHAAKTTLFAHYPRQDVVISHDESLFSLLVLLTIIAQNWIIDQPALMRVYVSLLEEGYISGNGTITQHKIRTALCVGTRFMCIL